MRPSSSDANGGVERGLLMENRPGLERGVLPAVRDARDGANLAASVRDG